MRLYSQERWFRSGHNQRINTDPQQRRCARCRVGCLYEARVQDVGCERPGFCGDKYVDLAGVAYHPCGGIRVSEWLRIGYNICSLFREDLAKDRPHELSRLGDKDTLA